MIWVWVWVLCYDRRSVGQSVLEQSTHLGPTTRYLLVFDNYGIYKVYIYTMYVWFLSLYLLIYTWVWPWPNIKHIIHIVEALPCNQCLSISCLAIVGFCGQLYEKLLSPTKCICFYIDPPDKCWINPTETAFFILSSSPYSVFLMSVCEKVSLC
jgi:hypothetical protein